MLLNLENEEPMKIVFLLSEELKVNTEIVTLSQALTLNESKPMMGLKGTNGLFGSKEWWENINNKRTPLLFRSGVISRTYVAGQDPSPADNSFTLLQDDGSTYEESMYMNDEKDINFFRVGHRVKIVYVLDELKYQHDGNANYLNIVLEMAVSLESVE